MVAVSNSGKGNAFINFGGKYPRQSFTGWIPKDSELAGGSTLAGLDGKKIKIRGTIELYKGKPEIKIISHFSDSLRHRALLPRPISSFLCPPTAPEG